MDEGSVSSVDVVSVDVLPRRGVSVATDWDWAWDWDCEGSEATGRPD